MKNKIVHIPVNKERKLNIIKWSIKFQLFKLNLKKQNVKKIINISNSCSAKLVSNSVYIFGEFCKTKILFTLISMFISTLGRKFSRL